MGDQDPDDVGDSTTRRGEDVESDVGREAGRHQAGTQGETDRPVGTSTARDTTGVDPQEAIDDDSPAEPSDD